MATNASNNIFAADSLIPVQRSSIFKVGDLVKSKKLLSDYSLLKKDSDFKELNLNNTRHLLKSQIQKFELGAKQGLFTNIKTLLSGLQNRLAVLASSTLEPAKLAPEIAEQSNASEISQTVARSASSLNLSGSTEINPNIALKQLNTEIAFTSGTFTITGKTLTVNKDLDTFNTVLNRINTSGAGVTATLEQGKLVLRGATVTTANGTSNFWTATKVPITSITGTKATVTADIPIAYSADKAQVRGNISINFSTDVGQVGILNGATISITAIGNYDFGTVTINTKPVNIGILTVSGANDTARSKNAADQIRNTINNANDNGGVFASSVLSGTVYYVRLQGDFDPININAVTYAAPAGDDRSAGFTVGMPMTTLSRPPQTDLGIFTLNTIPINLGVVKNSDFINKEALAQYVKTQINSYSGSTKVTADIDEENRLVLTHQFSGVNNIVLTGVTTESESPAVTANNKGVGLFNTTANPRTDFGKITINGTSINIGAIVNTNIAYDTLPELINFVVGRINSVATSTGVTPTFNGENKIVLTQNTAGANKSIAIQDITTDTNNYASDNQSVGFNLGTVAGTNAELRSTTTLGVSDYTRTLDALKGKFSPELISTTNGKFSINGVIINYNTATNKISDIVNNINNAPATRVTAKFDENSAIMLLTAHDPGDQPIELQDLTGNLLEAFKVQETKGNASAKSQTALGINGNAYAIDPNVKLKDLNIATSITSGTFTVNAKVITIDKNIDTFNTVLNKINFPDVGVTATLANDMLNLQSNASITLVSGTSNFLTATYVGLNNTTTTPATAANITGSVAIALTSGVDTTATNTGTAAITLSSDAGVIAPPLNGTNLYNATADPLNLAASTNYDFGTIQINGQNVYIGNYATNATDTVTVRSQNAATYIQNKINSTPNTGVTASNYLSGSYYRLRLTANNYGNILIGDVTYNDSGINRTTGFVTGQRTTTGRAPSTDFGSMTLNTYSIVLGTIPNAGNTNASALQYVVEQINSYKDFTNVVASIDPVSGNRVKLDQLTAGASSGINISAISNNSDSVGTNNFSSVATSTIGFVVSNKIGTDALTDFGNITINTKLVTFTPIKNREYTNTSAANYIATKINGTAGIGVTATVDSQNKIILTQNTPGSASTINITTVNQVGFAIGNTANGTNAVTTYNRTSTLSLGISDLARNMDTLGNKFATPLQSTTTGKMRVNGVDINYNTTIEKLQDVITKINATVPNVLASYNSSTNKFVIASAGASAITVTDITGNLSQALNLASEEVKTVVPYSQELGKNIQGQAGSGVGGVITSMQQWEKLTNISLNIQKGSLLLNESKIEINPDDTLDDALTKINSSNAGITAYLQGNRVVFSSDRPIDLNKMLDTSGFIKALGLDSVKQQDGEIAGVTGFKPITLKQGTKETDFGSVTINDVQIDIGTITNSDYNAKTAAEYIAKAINTKTTETNVGAYVDSQNRIVLRTGGTGENAIIDVKNVSSALGIGAGKTTGANYTLIGTVDVGKQDLTENIPDDVTNVLNGIKGFAERFNDTINVLSKNTKKGQILAHDPVADTLKKDLKNIVNTTLGEGEYNNLASVGITFNDNKLQIDETKLVTSLRTNPDAVLNLLNKAGGEFNKLMTPVNSEINRRPVLTKAVNKVLNDSTQRQTVETQKLILSQLTVLQKSQNKLNRQNEKINEIATPLARNDRGHFQGGVTNPFDEKINEMVGEPVESIATPLARNDSTPLINRDRGHFQGKTNPFDKKSMSLNVNGFGMGKNNELLTLPELDLPIAQMARNIRGIIDKNWLG